MAALERLESVLTPEVILVMNTLPRLLPMAERVGLPWSQNEGDLREVWYFGEGEMQIAEFSIADWAGLACDAVNMLQNAVKLRKRCSDHRAVRTNALSGSGVVKTLAMAENKGVQEEPPVAARPERTTYDTIRLTELLAYLGLSQAVAGGLMDTLDDLFQGDRDAVTGLLPFRELVPMLAKHHSGIGAALGKLEAEGHSYHEFETWDGLPFYVRLDLDSPLAGEPKDGPVGEGENDEH